MTPNHSFKRTCLRAGRLSQTLGLRGTQLRAVVVLSLGALVSACSPSEPPARSVELFVTPTAFVVDGTPMVSASEAAEAALKKEPTILLIPSCGAMETKRVLDIMASLKGKHSARIVMSVVGPGERGCPNYAQPQ